MTQELNLYGLQEEYLSIAQQLVEAGGEVTPELEKALELNKENFEIKSAKYAYVCKKYDGEIDLLDKEIERLTALKKARTTAKEKLEERVKNAMIMFEVKSIEVQNIKLSFRASKETIIEDEKLIPNKFKIPVPATYKLDKKAIKNAIEAGEKVKGARIKENKNLQIT